MADKFWIPLSALCANCGEVYALHGAVDPHQCPAHPEKVAGEWVPRDTHFKRKESSEFPSQEK